MNINTYLFARSDAMEEADPFTDIDENALEENELVLLATALCYLAHLYGSSMYTVRLFTCALESLLSNSSRGYYSRAATISFSTSRGAASI